MFFTPTLRRWQEIDARLTCGEFTVPEAMSELAAGLFRKANAWTIPHRSDQFTLWVIEPSRHCLIPGPVLLLNMGSLYGGPRLYRPLRDILRWDTGAFTTER